MVKTFRDNMLPAPLYSGNFLAYPFICDVSIVPDDYYYKFKTCFIDFFRASYAPHVFAKTKAPIGVNITITLQEIEIMLSEREVSSSERRIEELGENISNAMKLNERMANIEPALTDIRGLPESGPRR